MSHCCSDMTKRVEQVCKQHLNRWECPDLVMHYSEIDNRYGIMINDGGQSYYVIKFCPWCGSKV